MHKLRILAASVVFTVWGCNPALAEETTESGGLRLGGYSSASVIFHPGKRDEASLDEVSLFVSWDNNSRWRFFSEFELEQPIEWHEDESTHTRTKIDVERLYGEYDFSGLLNVRMGRFLTPIGRWNQIHAQPLVWTTIRPLATRQLFPLNIDGVMLSGAIALDRAGWENHTLEYVAYAEIVRDMEKDYGEAEYKRTAGARLVLNGQADIGLSLAHFEEDTRGQPDYTLLGLDFVTGNNGWEASGEIYRRFAQGNEGHGGYLQGVAPLSGQWSALARFESMHPSHGETTERWLVGAAWKPSVNNILKLEYVMGDEEVALSPKGFMASYAILF